jgi:hypothetical protein
MKQIVATKTTDILRRTLYEQESLVLWTEGRQALKHAPIIIGNSGTNVVKTAELRTTSSLNLDRFRLPQCNTHFESILWDYYKLAEGRERAQESLRFILICHHDAAWNFLHAITFNCFAMTEPLRVFEFFLAMTKLGKLAGGKARARRGRGREEKGAMTQLRPVPVKDTCALSLQSLPHPFVSWW